MYVALLGDSWPTFEVHLIFKIVINKNGVSNKKSSTIGKEQARFDCLEKKYELPNNQGTSSATKGRWLLI